MTYRLIGVLLFVSTLVGQQKPLPAIADGAKVAYAKIENVSDPLRFWVGVKYPTEVQKFSEAKIEIVLAEPVPLLKKVEIEDITNHAVRLIEWNFQNSADPVTQKGLPRNYVYGIEPMFVMRPLKMESEKRVYVVRVTAGDRYMETQEFSITLVK